MAAAPAGRESGAGTPRDAEPCWPWSVAQPGADYQLHLIVSVVREADAAGRWSCYRRWPRVLHRNPHFPQPNRRNRRSLSRGYMPQACARGQTRCSSAQSAGQMADQEWRWHARNLARRSSCITWDSSILIRTCAVIEGRARAPVRRGRRAAATGPIYDRLSLDAIRRSPPTARRSPVNNPPWRSAEARSPRAAWPPRTTPKVRSPKGIEEHEGIRTAAREVCVLLRSGSLPWSSCVDYSRRSLAPRDLTEWMRLDVALKRGGPRSFLTSRAILCLGTKNLTHPVMYI